jgi:predicted alpha/beta superfamily hydrolase
MAATPQVFICILGFSFSVIAALAGPAEVPVLFTNTAPTNVGTSIFVVGSVPQLGNWDPTRATKLVASNCVGSVCTWHAAIGIPEGTSFEYKFIERATMPDSSYADPANVAWEPGPNRGGAAPAGPPAPFHGKTVFYYSGWSSVSIIYSNTTMGWTAEPMYADGPGRTAGETLWRIDGINRPAEPNLEFVFTDNMNNYDNPSGPGTNYETPLDAFVVQDGQIYNYWPPPAVSTNRVETFFKSSTNLTGRTIRVYLPRGYSENTTKRYPVLYMHDGQNLFLGMGAFGSWNADTNANNLIRFGKMRETIIVGVDNTSDRLREYTPPGCSPPGGGSALGGNYASFLIDELKPVIDANYRTLPDVENTGVLGSSMGGLISAYLGWERSDTFHRIGAFSSSFQVCFPIPTPDTKRPIRIYVDSGDQNDGLVNTIAERDNLIRNGYAFNINLDHTIGYGHSHNEFWWDRRSPRAFTFLFPTSDEPNTILDTTVAPPRITDLQMTGASNIVTWTSYRLRTYTIQGSTNEAFSSSMNWSNLFTTAPEPRFWDYRSFGVTNRFNFFRVRQFTEPDSQIESRAAKGSSGRPVHQRKSAP